MENIKYKLYAKTNDANIIIDIKTDSFIKDVENWQEIGEQESRHFHEPITNNEGVYLFKLIDNVKTERATNEVDNETDKLISDNEKAQSKELMINNKIRVLAIKELQKENKLDNDENIV